MTVRDVESLLRLFTYLMLAYPVSIVVTCVLTSRVNHKWYMKWFELSGPREWRIRMAWRDRKIEQLTEQRDEARAELERAKVNASLTLRRDG